MFTLLAYLAGNPLNFCARAFLKDGRFCRGRNREKLPFLGFFESDLV